MSKIEKPVGWKISMFDFTITPLQISFKKTTAQTYLLELCKGAQVYKSFSESIWVHDQQKSYQLTNGQSVDLKLQNERGTKCQWTIYRLTDDEMKEYMISINADLTSFYNKYLDSLKENEKEYSRLLYNDNPNVSINKEWQNLKKKLPVEEDITATNTEFMVDVVFKVAVRCPMDLLAEEDKKRVLTRRMSKNSSKKSYQLSSKQNLDQQSSSPKLDRSPTSQSALKNKPSQVQIKVIKPTEDGDLVRRRQALSDIVELSNECSSMNPGEKSPNLNNSAFVRITQEDETSPVFHPSIKTQNFDDSKYKQMFKRRSNTSHDAVQKEVEEVTNSYQSMINSKIRDPTSIANIDQLDSKIESGYFDGQDTAVPSDVKTSSVSDKKQSSQNKKVSKESSVGSKLILILIIVLILGSLYFVDLEDLDNENPFSKTFTNVKKSKKPAKASKPKGVKVNKTSKVTLI